MPGVAMQIVEYLREQEQDMLLLLRHLAELETPSRDAARQEPIFDLLAHFFSELNYEVLRFPGQQTGGYMLARPLSRKRHVPLQLLVGHCDTVWPTGTHQEMPIHRDGDGRMKGPGIYDMKAGLTQILYALQALRDLQLNPDLTPLVLINSDEEIGSRESTRAIRRLARISDRAFVLEPPLGLDGKLKTARKGLGRYTLTVEGRASHAGLKPEEGASAIVELSYQIQALFRMNDPEKGITVNVGMVEGGVSPNVVAPQSKAVIDVRVLTREDAQKVEQQIFSLQPVNPEVHLKVEGGFGRPPLERTPRNQQLWETARQEGLKLGLELEQGTAGGGSDGNTTSQYTATLDGLGTPGDGAHARHEFIFWKQLKERTALLSLLLLAPPLGTN